MIDVYGFFFCYSRVTSMCNASLPQKNNSYSHSFFVLQVMDEGQWLHRGALTTTSWIIADSDHSFGRSQGYSHPLDSSCHTKKKQQQNNNNKKNFFLQLKKVYNEKRSKAGGVGHTADLNERTIRQVKDIKKRRRHEGEIQNGCKD